MSLANRLACTTARFATSSGTKRVKDIRPGSLGSGPNVMVRVGSTLYFPADDGTHGSELWKSNGTTGGTKRVKDVNLVHP
jgi:ELWxxDGT repeat protein